MQERAFADPKIEIAWNSAVEAIHGDDKLTGADPARHRRPARSASSTRPGCSSRSATTRARSCSRGQVDLDDEGYVLVDAPLDPHQPAPACSPAATWSTTTTGRPITAAGTGCAAALDAERYLADLDHAATTGSARRRGRAAHRAGADRRRLSRSPTWSPRTWRPARRPDGKKCPRRRVHSGRPSRNDPTPTR